VADPSIHILFPFRDGPWGGSNQFLRALRDELQNAGVWADRPEDAGIVLFDSFNAAAEVIACKRRLPHVPFVQRIDGPISLYRGRDRHVDHLIYALGAAIADGIIFQSHYSQRANLALGMPDPARSAVILNAPNAEFHPAEVRAAASGRIRLIASSWSANWNKGFDVYRHLDEHLDFDRYEMTFVGNSPIEFRNIRLVPPLDSAGLAALMRSHDLYVTASRNDPCSNSLAEALASGLPAVVLNSGGHPELLGNGGTVFEGPDDVLAAIDRASANLAAWRAALSIRTIAGVAGEYRAFLSRVHATVRPPRALSRTEAWRLTGLLHLSHLRGKIANAGNRWTTRLRRGGDSRHADPLPKIILRKGYRLACASMVAVNCALPRRRDLAVHYGGARIGDVGGPLVKVKRLSEYFPDHPLGFNLVYLLSNAPYLPKPALQLLKARGIPIVLNQNGVFYPGWYAGDWQTPNRVMAESFHLADWVFFQSEFCRRAAEKFLGRRQGRSEILYNAVDTTRFRPAARKNQAASFTFLITGKIGDHLGYRLDSTIAGLARARSEGLDAQLRIAGYVSPAAQAAARQLAQRLELSDHVSFTGPYRQEEAPAIYTSADAYVMTKYNDPCPNTVLEALACGLPVLYSNSGGVPELVGPDAGIGLDCGGEHWDRPHVPTSEAIAAGMCKIAEAPAPFADAARRRAVERFDIGFWIERHRTVFEMLLKEKR
jgi:glycosyltransferase involved in cell wall biosynthesis